jgi:predicted nucleic acid-binding protein
LKFYVVDASVGVKWCLPTGTEVLMPEARSLLRAHSRGEVRLFIPDLFWAEIGNVLWNAIRIGKITESQAAAGIVLMRELGLRVFDSAELLDRALQIAVAYARTVYDSLYVALSVTAAAELITADERLVNALGSRYPVRWLGSL